jgi:elongation factor P hydroxylase
MTVARGLTDDQIAGCFNRRLGRRHGVRLIGGAAEPLYEPGSEGGTAIIRYTRDYAASALHELAHWCIAGARRRQLPDYGYWYRPPPRTNAEQSAFYRAEMPVQALEARLAAAAGLPFRVSVDDLDREPSAASVAATRRFVEDVQALSDRMAYQAVSSRAAELEANLRRYRRQVHRSGLSAATTSTLDNAAVSIAPFADRPAAA